MEVMSKHCRDKQSDRNMSFGRPKVKLVPKLLLDLLLECDQEKGNSS